MSLTLSDVAARRKDLAAFNACLATWLEARAALQRHECSEDRAGFDERWAELSDRVEGAERVVMTTPVPFFWMIWRKFEIFEHAMCAGDGELADRRHVWMLGSIKADLLRLGPRLDEVGEA